MKNSKCADLKILTEIKKCGSPVGAIQLSDTVSISQATIGRALIRLEREGLLEKVSNKGRVITKKGIAYINDQSIKVVQEDNINRLIEVVNMVSKESLVEIIEVRKLLEVKAIELACINATSDNINELENILLEHEYVLNNGKIGCDLDLEFHLAIAKLSLNTTIYQIMKLILTENNVYTMFSIAGEKFKDSQMKHHKEIIETIKNKDTEKAKEAMYKHLEEVRTEVELLNYNQ